MKYFAEFFKKNIRKIKRNKNIYYKVSDSQEVYHNFSFISQIHFYQFQFFLPLFPFLFSGLNFQIPIISAQNDCAPAAMSKCTDPLKVVTDNKDLGFATSKEELIKMCP